MIKDFKQGLAYGYPLCCITAFVVRGWFVYPILMKRFENGHDITLTTYSTEPQVKCPYHAFKYRKEKEYVTI